MLALPMALFENESLAHVVRVFGLRSSSAISVQYHGVVDGYPLSIQANGDRSGALVVSVSRLRPSDLGLSLTLSTAFFSSEDFASGSVEFDALWSRSCARCSVELAPQLTTADVRAALMSIARTGGGGLCDDLAWGDANSVVWTGEEFERFVRAVVAAARAADEATVNLAAPLDLQRAGAVDALESLAREHSLTFARHPLTVAGMLGDDRFSLRAIAHYTGRRLTDPLHGATGQRGYDASVHFNEPLRGALSLRPASALDRVQAVLGMGDIETGDAAFDRAWTIQCSVEGDRDGAVALVREQLNDRARALLTRIAARGFVLSLDARGVVGRGAFPKERGDVEEVVRSLAALRQALRGSSSHTPYR